MAPEQASGQRDLGPACDIYSLGGVFFECLTGQPPFVAEHAAALLAKILLQEVRRLRQIRQELPQVLDDLTARMLARPVHERISDAAALCQALAELPTLEELAAPAVRPDVPAFSSSGHEQQLVSVIVAVRNLATSVELPTLAVRLPETNHGEITTLRRALAPHGALVELLADGSAVATLGSATSGSAMDQALQAARCALLFRELWPEACVILVTGRGILAKQMPIGEAIDRAWELLNRYLESKKQDLESCSPVLLLDEATAGLLDARFTVRGLGTGCFSLHGERASFDAGRPLLGKATPCIGRERELAVLEGVFAECRDESMAQVALLTAAPGMGKSRLRHEFLRRLTDRQEPVEILFGRGDPMTTGSPYGQLGKAIYGLCEVNSGEALAKRQEKLRQRIGLRLPLAEQKRVVEFIGEMCGTPFSDVDSPALRAARQEPHILSDQIRQATIDWLQAECAHCPVLLILEDLHWGDILTVRLVDVLLRDLAKQSFMVLGVAHPEVETHFPSLFSKRRRQDIRLEGLSKKASLRLARQILGNQVSDDVLERIVEQAAGNALYLEELIRATAEGKGDSLPETILAMLQARLMRLEAPARRVLKAASLYGQTFWGSGLGEEDDARWLQVLLDFEFIEEHRNSRFLNIKEYGFRHALMREATYSLLGDEEKRQGHGQAARFLEQAGERDPLMLAEHWQLAGILRNAAHFYALASEQALGKSDLEGALRLVKRSMDCDPDDAELGILHSVSALAYAWLDDWNQSYKSCEEALPRIPAGSQRWCKLMAGMMMVCTGLGKTERLVALFGQFTTTQPFADARAAYAEGICWLLAVMASVGHVEPVRGFAQILRQLAAIAPDDAALKLWVSMGEMWFAHYIDFDPWATVVHAQNAALHAKEIGDLRNEIWMRSCTGLYQSELGEHEQAESTVRAVFPLHERVGGEILIITNTSVYLALILSQQRNPERLEEAVRLAQTAILAPRINPPVKGLAYQAMARALLGLLRPKEAEEAARHGCALLQPLPALYFGPMACLIQALSDQGYIAETQAVIAQCEKELQQAGHAGPSEVYLQLVIAKSATSSKAAAHAALLRGLVALLARASKISDSTARERFRTKVQENAELLALAAEKGIKEEAATSTPSVAVINAAAQSA